MKVGVFQLLGSDRISDNHETIKRAIVIRIVGTDYPYDDEVDRKINTAKTILQKF